MNTNNHARAFDEIKEVISLSDLAYNAVEDFGKKIISRKLSLIGRVMTLMYDEKEGRFLAVSELPEALKNDIAIFVQSEVIEGIADHDFEILKIPKLKKTKKNVAENNQNLLDSLLKFGLPFMWFYIDLFREETANSQVVMHSGSKSWGWVGFCFSGSGRVQGSTFRGRAPRVFRDF